MCSGYPYADWDYYLSQAVNLVRAPKGKVPNGVKKNYFLLEYDWMVC